MKDSGTKAGKKRELILKAAVQVFSAKGYHNTRMEEIAAVAGIGKGTIYEYFASKLQLFQAMMGSSLEFYYENVRSQGRDFTLKERLLHLFEAHLRFCRDNRELTRIVFWDSEIWDEELKEWTWQTRKDKQQVMYSMVEEGIRRGEIRAADPNLVTLMIIGLVGSVWVPITLEDWDIAPDELARQMVELIIQGLSPDEDIAGAGSRK